MGARRGRLAYAGHLVRRFVTSLWPAGPRPADDEWAVAHLGAAEVALWRRMSRADRRHAVSVARRAVDLLGARATRPVVAAALLHDVGKISSGLGPVRRAAATVVGMAVGHRRARGWAHAPGARGRVGRYLAHDEIGAGLLGSAGSEPLPVAWAREHHLPADRWTVPAEVGAALRAADDD